MMKVSAPGNVFFLGEHSVVYERPALVASIDRRTYISGEDRDDGKVLINSKGYGKIESTVEDLRDKVYSSEEDYKDGMDPLRDLLGYFSQEIKDMDEGFEAVIESDIPRNSGGQSSSTAVLSASLKFLSEVYGAGIPKEDYFEHLYPFQVRIHGGAASGSELTSSVFGGYNKVIKTPGKENPLDFENLGNLELDLVIGDTGNKARTSKTVGRVREGWKHDKNTYEKIFDDIGDLVRRAEDIISQDGSLEDLGELMYRNHEILADRLEVSSPKLDELVEAARESGAYGAKLSGGGDGGIMVALCDEDNKRKVAKAIEDKGGKAATTEIGVGGAREES